MCGAGQSQSAPRPRSSRLRLAGAAVRGPSAPLSCECLDPCSSLLSRGPLLGVEWKRDLEGIVAEGAHAYYCGELMDQKPCAAKISNAAPARTRHPPKMGSAQLGADPVCPSRLRSSCPVVFPLNWARMEWRARSISAGLRTDDRRFRMRERGGMLTA